MQPNQWSLELLEKFNLPSVILDARIHRQAQAGGSPNPFATDRVVITSLNFASAMRAEIRAVAFDLVVIDEAHKLRNAYRPSNKIGQNIKWAVEERRKLLLTATPLQNSLLELFRLATVLDDLIFGDANSFRSQYATNGANAKALRDRLQHFCQRTLRRQVVEYIQLKQLFANSRKGQLELGNRQLLWATLGPRSVNQRGMAVFGTGHRRRTVLAMECVKLVLPHWRQRRPDDHMPMALLAVAKDYVTGKATAQSASKLISQGWVHGDNLGCEYADRNDSDGQRLMMVCHASVDVVRTALGDEEFDPERIDPSEIDGGRDVYTWTPAIASACTLPTIPPSSSVPKL